MKQFLALILLSILFIAPAENSQAAAPPALEKHRGINDLFQRSPKEELEQSLDIEIQEKDPELTEKLVARYFDNCMSQPSKNPTSADIKEYLCLCTAQQIEQQIAPADIALMFTKTPEGEFQRQRVIGEIYVPCLKKPLNILTTQKCTKNPEMREKYTKYQAVCQCVSDQASAFVIKNKKIPSVRSNPNLEDLLHQFMRDAPFRTRQYQVERSCSWKYEKGL